MKTKSLLKSTLLLGLIGLTYFVLYHTETGKSLNYETLLSWIRQYGSLAPLIYISVYIVGTVALVPGTLLSFVGAVLFGAYYGTAYTWLGAWIGAILSFLVSRALGRPFVQELVGKRLSRLEAQIRDNGFRGMLIIRLIPLFPFPSVNFASGLTSIRFWDYVFATAIGIIPGTFVYQFLFAKFGQRILTDGLFRKEYLSDPELWIALGLFLSFVLIGKWASKRYQSQLPVGREKPATTEPRSS